MQVFNLVSFPILKIKLFIKMFPGLLLASTFVPFERHKFAVHTELYKFLLHIYTKYSTLKKKRSA